MKSAIDLYNHAVNLTRKESYLEAVILFKMAEKNSLNDKFPEASFEKANLFVILERFDEALDSYDKAENDCPNGKYPEASFYKGILLMNLEEYEKAIVALEKAERDSLKGKYPEASLNKGSCFANLEEYERAIVACEKAERDGPKGKYPEASLNIGSCFVDLEEYERAIVAFEKAERDSPNGKFPKVSYNKGVILLMNLEEYEKAIVAFEKAERDSPNGKFPLASINKGNCLVNLKEYGKALEAYRKAERDSPGSKYPDASLNIGLLLIKIKEDIKALEAFEKAERDSSNGKYPAASYSRGQVLGELNEFNKALEAFEKAERDSPNGKYPDASYLRAITYKNQELNQLAKEALNKTLNDSKDNYYPEAHLCLSQIYNKYDNELSSYHAFTALKQSSYDYEIFSWLSSNFSSVKTEHIYANRTRYFDLLLSYNAEKDYEPEILNRLKKVITVKSDTELAYDYLYCFLLSRQSHLLKLDLSDDDLLRYAYLIHFANSRPEETYYVIDYLLEESVEELNAMDKFFYIWSAYLIGEPVSVLEELLNSEPDNHPFALVYLQTKELFMKKIKAESYLDSYLLDISQDDLKHILSQIISDDLPYILQDVIVSIKLGNSYKIPYSVIQLKGLCISYLYQSNKENIDSFVDNNRFVVLWDNFELSLKNRKDHTILHNIRELIKSNGEPIQHAIHSKLVESYMISGDIIDHKRILIFQVIAFISYKYDYKKEIVINNEIIQCIMESGVIETILIITTFSFPGTGTALSGLFKAIKLINKSISKRNIDAIFETLLNEIRISEN